MASLAINGLEKRYGSVRALAGIALDVPDGEFCVVVGRSGAGKSTLLRTVAGLETSDAGTIAIDGEDVRNRRPHERDVAMVFQSDALFPALSAYSNFSFGLKARRVPSQDVEPRVQRAAAILGVTELLGSPTRLLAPAARQRVAIGRAVVREARLCLLDDPLAALDPELREEIRGEVKRLHVEFPGTKIFVTHDPVEAMMLAERTVLLREGRIEQEGTPLALFERPATRFVAGFFGSPKMNFLSGALTRTAEGDAIRLDGESSAVPLPPNRVSPAVADGLAVVLGLRPEHMMRAVRVSPPDGTLRWDAEIELLRPIGSRAYATFRMAGVPVVAELQAHDVTRAGDRVPIDINLKRVSIFDAATEKAL